MNASSRAVGKDKWEGIGIISLTLKSRKLMKKYTTKSDYVVT